MYPLETYQVLKSFEHNHIWSRRNGKKALLSLSYQEGEFVRLSSKRTVDYKSFIEEGYMIRVS